MYRKLDSHAYLLESSNTGARQADAIESDAQIVAKNVSPPNSVDKVVEQEHANAAPGHADLDQSNKAMNASVSSSSLPTRVPATENGNNANGNLSSLTYSLLFRRLHYGNLQLLNRTLGQMKKIPYTEHAQKQRQLEKSQPNRSVQAKHPILTSHLTDKQATKGQPEAARPRASSASLSSSKPSNNLGKRSHNHPEEHAKRKRVSSNDTRNIFISMARDVEALADANPEKDGVSDDDDLETWCLSKVVRAMDKYKNKEAPTKGHSDRRNKH